jgi:hypothetical protein
MSESTGVVFPLIEGRRSTAATGRMVVADALRAVDPIGAAAAERETNWRAGYLVHFRRLVEAGLPSADAALTIARDGLTSVHSRLQWGDPDAADAPLASAFGQPPAPAVTEEVRGTGEREAELSVPYRGERLRGDALRRQVDAWIAAGTAEPSLAEVVDAVIDHPDWLRLPDRTVVVLGAAAEMGPLRSLLRWGATVAAVDLPRPGLWETLLADAGRSAGRLLVPARPGEKPLATRAGGDLIHDLSTVGSWVSDLAGPLVLGNYVYADGATNVRVCAAVDALTEHVRGLRSSDEVALSFLATPTDVFAVPGDAVAASAQSYAQRRVSKALRVPLRTLSAGRLLRRNYVPGEDPGINDSVVTQQGPNYLLAKRIQRWRAAVDRAEGASVSFHIAPPTRTRSVVKNRALAAAYAGAHRFGIEVFEPGTSNTLMAALLVHDVMTGPRESLGHPWLDEAHAAVHGGLWRAAYDPRSALGLAALLGFGASR